MPIVGHIRSYTEKDQHLEMEQQQKTVVLLLLLLTEHLGMKQL
jgi:hypothetical protein